MIITNTSSIGLRHGRVERLKGLRSGGKDIGEVGLRSGGTDIGRIGLRSVGTDIRRIDILLVGKDIRGVGLRSGGKGFEKLGLRSDGMECGGGSTGCSPASRRLRLYLLHVRIMSPSNGGLTRMQMLDARLYPAWQLYKLVSYSNYKFSDLSTYA